MRTLIVALTFVKQNLDCKICAVDGALYKKKKKKRLFEHIMEY